MKDYLLFSLQNWQNAQKFEVSRLYAKVDQFASHIVCMYTARHIAYTIYITTKEEKRGVSAYQVRSNTYRKKMQIIIKFMNTIQTEIHKISLYFDMSIFHGGKICIFEAVHSDIYTLLTQIRR